jgi:hypothetical protein
MHSQLLVLSKQQFDWPTALSFRDHGGVITRRLVDIPMVQGLDHRNFFKYLHDEILLVVHPIGREFSTFRGLLVKEKRETFQNQIPNLSTNLRIGEVTGRPVIFPDKGTQFWRAQEGIQF